MKIKTRFQASICLFLLAAAQLHAQVGINNSSANPDPSAILDLQTGNTGVNKGFLPQSVALTATNAAAPVTSPATGLIVYNTATSGTVPNNVVPGYYYWSGSAWMLMLAPNAGTSGQVLTSNGGGAPGWTTLPTLPSNVVTGTGIYKYVARWTPNGDTLGTGLIIDNDTGVGINSAPVAGTMLYVQNGAGTGVAGIGTVSGDGIYGLDSANVGVNGLGVRSGAIGVFGTGDSGAGVYGSSAHGFAVLGLGNDVNAFGVAGENLAAAGTGVYGYGDTAAAFYGNWNGVNAYSAANVAFYGEAHDGYAGADIRFLPGTATTGAAIQTSNTLTGNTVSVNYFDGTTAWKITGGGSVGTVVKDDKGDNVRLACPETPEILFEDYGEGQLVNGRAHIDLDPIIAKNVIINEQHPLRVYIELLGDCNGTYVANRSATGFDVIELKGGTSNTAFQWHIICNRADEQMANGNVSHNADIRFAKVVENTNLTNQGNTRKSPVTTNIGNSKGTKRFAPLQKVNNLSTEKSHIKGKN